MNPNLPKTLPRSPNYGGHLFRRSHFLAGDQNCFFGPGQHPGVSSSYFPPTDWPAAGRLLRVPQVACLSAMYPQIMSFVDATTAHTLNTFFFSFPGHPGTSLGVTVTDVGFAEYARMRTVLAAVKSQVEALRPGRTYVIAADYLTGSTVFDLDFRYSLPDGYLCTLAPGGFTALAGFFGTDFLHIHIGHVWWGEGSTADTIDPNDVGSFPALGSDTNYSGGKSRLVSYHGKFPRHSTRLYTATGMDWRQYVYPADEAAVAGLIADGYTLDGTGVEDAVAASDARLSAVASDLAAYDVTLVGDALGVSAATLVAAIASHFRFDPSSGADLPPA